jgi:transcriptional activator protein UGA3
MNCSTTTTETPARVPRRRFATSGRVRSGCLTCKARKKKCDERYTRTSVAGEDRCETCARLGLVCERAPLRTVIGKQKKASPSRTPLSASESESESEPDLAGRPVEGEMLDNSFMALFSLEKASPERILLKYYVERLALLCSILQEGNNEFRNVLLPMAIDDSSLLYALFAYASIHLPTASSGPSISPLARLQFESAAARGLCEAIQRNEVCESTIACALICSTAEVIRGDTQKWFLHLQGAGHLIGQCGGPDRLRQTSDGRFLLRNFAYHDILAALSTGGRPRIGGVYWVEEDGFVSADCLMGVSHEILGHLSDLCVLIADATEENSTGVIQRGECLARVLQTQQLNLCTTLSSTELAILLHHTEAFRFAGLLHLYQFLSRFADTYQSLIAECVRKILEHISQVPPGYHCEVGLVFPLFMAGVVAEGDDRTYVKDRLDHIFSWTQFKHIRRIQQLLGYLWSAGRTDWERVVQEFGWQVSMA